MKLTNGDIFIAKEPLQTLMGQKLPILVSYKLAKMAKKLEEQWQVVEEVRSGLVKRFGQESGNGQTIVPESSENFPQFLDEFNELMALEVELVIEKVRLPSEGVEIEAAILMALDKFVEV